MAFAYKDYGENLRLKPWFDIFFGWNEDFTKLSDLFT